MADTYTLISSVTVGAGGASSIEFTSIPATYTDLLVLTSCRSNRTGDNNDAIKIQFNGDTGNNYSIRYLFTSDGATTGSGSSSSISFGVGGFATATNATSNTFGNSSCYIPNYAGSNQKSFSTDEVIENNATASTLRLEANLWTGTAAISSIKLAPNVGTLFNQYSTAYLYGISNS